MLPGSRSLNLANAVAAHAAHAGIPSYVFVPANLEQGKIVTTGVYGGNVVAIDGNYDDAVAQLRDHGLLLATVRNSRGGIPAGEVINQLEKNSALGKVLGSGLRALNNEPQLGEEDLRAAMEAGDLYLHYQPQFTIATDKVLGLELEGVTVVVDGVGG